MTSDPRHPSTSASPLSSRSLGRSDDERPGVGQVAAYSTLIEAEMARGRLEAAGIPARIVDGNTVGVAHVLSNLVGGVKITVAVEDLEEAREILQSPPELVEPDLDPEPAAEAAEDPAEARLSTRDDLALRAFRASLLGFVVVPPFLHLWSAWLLVRYALSAGEVSQEGARRARAALAVDVAVAALIALVLARL